MSEKLVLDPEKLSTKDMKRARKMLAKREEGQEPEERNPWKLLEDPDEAVTLTIWCLQTRTEPDFTWEQAEETEFGNFDAPPPKDPPPTAPLSSPGSKPKGGAKTQLSKMPSD